MPRVGCKVFLIAGATLLLAAQAARAQEIRYIYDKLGRLIGVVDQQGRTAIYDYDPVGNITAIRRQDATGPVAITLVNPNTGSVGTQVEIVGIGFSDVASQNQITFNGVAASVLNASPNSLTTQVPSGATTGPINVSTPLGSAVSPEPFKVVANIAITISPAQAIQVAGTSRQFTAAVTGIVDQQVTWEASLGGITSDGLFTAPPTVPTPATGTIRASSLLFPEFSAEATVTIVKEATDFALAAVSVRFGTPPVGSVPGAVTHAVSVAFGTPPVGAVPGAVTHAVSVARAPVVLGLTPNQGLPGSTIPLTVSGANLTGATGLAFLLQGGTDADISIANISVSPGGDVLTATMTIAPTPPAGPRIVIVNTPSASSTAADTGSNVFTVTTP